MNDCITYGIIFLILLALELVYFKVADRFDIIDKPNQRSSHTTVVLRGGGVIFMFGIWLWGALSGLTYPWFLLGFTLAAGISFIDDIRSLPDSIRLVAHFVAMALMFLQIALGDIGFGNLQIWQWALIAFASLVVFVGATNIINFMDGINGITGAYAMANLIPLGLLNSGAEVGCFIDQSLIYTVIVADIVFCIFNFRPKGKAKCFAGDVGSIGVGMILLFFIGSLIMKTGDVTYLIFLLVYGVDGFLTICHRIMLHENLGVAHRKHAYQLMCNELKMGHVTVSILYAVMQLIISLGFVYLCPNSIAAHWGYLIAAFVVLVTMYLLFMKKYYHLHEEYLARLDKQ